MLSEFVLSKVRDLLWNERRAQRDLTEQRDRAMNAVGVCEQSLQKAESNIAELLRRFPELAEERGKEPNEEGRA